MRLLLAHEVDHRAKNALTVVQSLLRLTPAHGEEAKRFARAAAGRVAAMARAHGLLSRDRWTGTDLRSLAKEELAPFVSAESDQVRLEGPSLRLAADAAQSISMLLHELSTNAAKYGALSTPDGQVDVTWAQDPAAGGDLRLDWRESGGPPVAGPSSDGGGFGSRLIELITGQFGGVVDFTWNPEGLQCTLRLPADRFSAAVTEPRSA